MKVTQQSEPKFIPVVITLETQEEVDILHNLSGQVSGTGKPRKTTDMMYSALTPYVSPSHKDYFEGTLTINPY